MPSRPPLPYPPRCVRTAAPRLTLRNGEEIVIRRVVSAAQLADEKRMYWFINAVRRDLALGGSLPVDVVGTCVVCRSAACRATWRAERFVRESWRRPPAGRAEVLE